MCTQIFTNDSAIYRSKNDLLNAMEVLYTSGKTNTAAALECVQIYIQRVHKTVILMFKINLKLFVFVQVYLSTNVHNS